MEDFIVIVYPSESRAEKIREKCIDMPNKAEARIGDAIIAVRLASGRVKISQILDPESSGATSGLWAALVSALFFRPVASDEREDYLSRHIAAGLPAGGAALFVQANKAKLPTILEALRGSGGKVLATSMGPEAERVLRSALRRVASVAA